MVSTTASTFDLSILPSSEDDKFEFKSSRTPHSELKKKISASTSAFANSGGGYFIAGVDDSGSADGGLPETIGKADLRDWIDQIIHQIEPTPSYEVHLLDDLAGRGEVQPKHKVLIIEIEKSHLPPYMAQDGRYYIRAGAHTVRSRHFIV
jgi:predicted HTH transcriptional regulator